MSLPEVVIVGAARTPIGEYGGRVPQRASGRARRGRDARRTRARRGRRRTRVDEVLIGHGRQAGSGPNPARQVVRRAGLPGLGPGPDDQQGVRVGHAGDRRAARSRSCSASPRSSWRAAIESMSRMPYLIDSEDARWGHKMGNFTLVDAMYRDGFTCPLSSMIMGETAELLAREYGITREESDAYALETQRRAAAAITAGRFRDEMALRHRQPTRKDARRSSTRTNIRARRPPTCLKKLAPVLRQCRGAARHHHRRDFVGHHRRRRRVGPDERRARERDEDRSARQDHRVGIGRRRSALHGDRSRAGHAQAVRRARDSRSRISTSSS